jgi:phosphoribosylanthranilate isomerase
MSTRVKFCGCTSWADVELAVGAGADAFGMIFAPSKRRIAWEEAREIAARLDAPIAPVGVFVNPERADVERARALFPALIVQLSGDESPQFVEETDATVVKAIHVAPGTSGDELEKHCNRYPSALVLFDTMATGRYGGTGLRFDWSKVERIARRRPVVMAGGLNPENVGECVRAVHPAWVDVRSGIETAGRKDVEKMQRFIRAVRENDAA